MKFTPEHKKIFNKNLKSLEHLVLLKEELKKIQKVRCYELKLGKDALDINLKDLRDNSLIYKDIQNTLNEHIRVYNEKYIYYPVLFYYGFGNGLLYKFLLQQKHLKMLVIFENELEIVYLMFHLVDFSKELAEKKLFIFDPTKLLEFDLYAIFLDKTIKAFSGVYHLELHSDYYEKFSKSILSLNESIIKVIKTFRFQSGNDTQDALVGIRHTASNVLKMINRPNKREFAKRYALAQNAIIVSTGPSLIKQLSLLKAYANKALICCADSAYPILASKGIKPDYVFTLERIAYTSELFNNDFKDFDKDITFIVASVAHANTFKYLEQNNRFYMITLKSSTTFQYKIYDFVQTGQSVAHMAYDFACNIGAKNIILIGQDLAYSKEGKSHPKEYLYGEDDLDEEGEFKDGSKALAYGGDGFVETNQTWEVFRGFFEFIIPRARGIGVMTFNCTEGGVRIKGTIEIPFKQACEELLTKDLHKPFPAINMPSQKFKDEYLFKVFTDLIRVFKEGDELIDFFTQKQEILSILMKNALDMQDESEQNFLLEEALKNIDKLKEKIEEITSVPMSAYSEILTPILYQFEFNVVKIYVFIPKTKQEALEKKTLWISKHLELINMIIGHIKIHKQALYESSQDIFAEVKNRGFEERFLKIQERIMGGGDSYFANKKNAIRGFF
ncbi:PseD protein [Campylobacter sp. MIT 99-7217]|uniref:motility associated factor glycosyltransferase family protein n=1 Tax=Campylobacter sp. MIT 99-7217 TaxID=535091 RepID=UPI0011590862|nr:motility associated factor glycosyltransferase family protein [Campylobacter sp. MIT 99-7217]TQR33823.1 PseD protein [Campylobacter sp. MIT 99-7217]